MDGGWSELGGFFWFFLVFFVGPLVLFCCCCWGDCFDLFCLLLRDNGGE